MKYYIDQKLIKCQESEYIDPVHSRIIIVNYPNIKVYAKISELERLVSKNNNIINNLSSRHKIINDNSLVLEQKINDITDVLYDFSIDMEDSQYDLATLKKLNKQFSQHSEAMVDLIAKNHDFITHGFESEYHLKEIFALLGVVSTVCYFWSVYGYAKLDNKIAINLLGIGSLVLVPLIFSEIEQNNNVHNIIHEIHHDSQEIENLLGSIKQEMSGLDLSQ